MRRLDAAGYLSLSDEGKARCADWLARHDIHLHDTQAYTEVKPGLFVVEGVTFDDDRRLVVVDGDVVRWERTVIDECPPPFLS